MVQRRLRARFVVGPLAAVALVAFAAGSAVAADHAVAISGFTFSPATITVSVGDTVTWTNSDAQGHTATADGGAFDTGTLGNGASDTVTFSTAGSFPYHCSIHPDMTGTVTVAAASGGGGGGGATQPATDTEELATSDSTQGLLAAVLVLAGALLVGFVAARQRLARGSSRN